MTRERATGSRILAIKVGIPHNARNFEDRCLREMLIKIGWQTQWDVSGYTLGRN
jgi:hypothetical protein